MLDTTTPDTLASLIARWKAPRHAQHYDKNGNETFVETFYCSYEMNCAKQLEAALDALAERWEAKAENMGHCNCDDSDSGIKYQLQACAAELRGRGASDGK